MKRDVTAGVTGDTFGRAKVMSRDSRWFIAVHSAFTQQDITHDPDPLISSNAGG